MALVLASPSPFDSVVRTHNAPGKSNSDTHRAIGRELAAVVFEKRDDLVANATVALDRSWTDATLLAIGQEAGNTGLGIEIKCKYCYVKGIAKAELNVKGDFNISQAVDNTIKEVEGEIKNLTAEVKDYVEDTAKEIGVNLLDGFDIEDFTFPTMNFTFDVDFQDIPETMLRFQFDGLELYMDLDTKFSSSSEYILNLFASNTPVGISIGRNLRLGVVFSIDLILSAEAEIAISNGFHIKLDDEIAIELPLFAKNIANVDFTGGQFEFLPVTIESAGVVFSAILRIGIYTGLSLRSDSLLSTVDISGGIEVVVFADVAEFTTNVTVVPQDEDCKLRVIQAYQLGLGAEAGASVAIEQNTWGPVPETKIPIWYTTMADICAISGEPTSTSTPTVTARAIAGRQEDLTTMTLTEVFTYTGVACQSPGLQNCPASLQETTQAKVTSTIVTAVPSGADPTFPSPVLDTVVSTITFGSGAQRIEASSGSPVSYVPAPPTPTDKGDKEDKEDKEDKDGIDGETGGVSNKVIVGVSVGLGVPAMIAVVAGFCYFLIRRKKYAAVPKAEQSPILRGITSKKPNVGVSVVEPR
ncbi:hypothetical protein FQN57_001914 [Myotisia sp. PD_48]|nr:hypothetical protein FQN57_001914 [Myotisia sp. PD_48]